MTNVENTHYLMGSVCGPHPYPTMVRDFQSIIGQEVRKQCPEQVGRMPDMLVACVEAGLGLNQAIVRVSDEVEHISEAMSE